MGFALAFIMSPSHPLAEAIAAPELGPQEQAFVALINDYRQENGLQPLTVDWELQSSSDWMSEDMGTKAYVSHTDSLGRDPWARMCAFEYDYDTWEGENIAAGYRTAAKSSRPGRTRQRQRQHVGIELHRNGHLAGVPVRQSLRLVLDQ